MTGNQTAERTGTGADPSVQSTDADFVEVTGCYHCPNCDHDAGMEINLKTDEQTFRNTFEAHSRSDEVKCLSCSHVDDEASFIAAWEVAHDPMTLAPTRENEKPRFMCGPRKTRD